MKRVWEEEIQRKINAAESTVTSFKSLQLSDTNLHKLKAYKL